MARILIADDDVITQKQAALMVEKMGHTFLTSPNGKHAYETLCAYNKIELLISDVVMPEMDGKELLRCIRSDTKFQQLPIIIMSGVIGVKEVGGLLELGANFFLGKPLSHSQFAEYVEKCLKK